METPSYNQLEEFPVQAADSGGSEWVKKLPMLLRTIGTVAVILSMYSFLVRGWEGSSDLVRYFMLLGHTGSLGVIALASGHYLKEGKGPRLLLMLALVSVPVNFAILGAFQFSSMVPDGLANYPNYVTWSVGSTGVAAICIGVAIMVLAPLSLIGFRGLARGMSKSMTLLFLLGNAALLVPVRDPMLVSGMALGLGCYILYVTSKTARLRSEAKTSEGLFTLLLQFLPIGILLGRNIWLYAPEQALLAAASATGFLALRQCHSLLKSASAWRILAEILSVSLAVSTGINGAAVLQDSGIGGSTSLVAGSMIAAGLIYELSLRVRAGAAICRVIAIGIATMGLVLNLVLYGGVFASILTLGLGVAGIFTSYTLQQWAILVGSVVLVVAGLVDQYLNMGLRGLVWV